MVVAFSAIQSLRKRYSRIHGICQGAVGELACRLGIFDRAFSIESAIFSTLFAHSFDSRLIEFLKCYDILLCFSFSKDLEAAVRKQTPGAVFRITPRPRPSRRMHVAYHIEENLLAMGLSEGALLRQFDEEGRFVGTGAVPIKKSNPIRVLLHIGSGSPRKNWPLDHFKAVYRELIAKNMKPAFLLGPAERHRKAELKRFECRIPKDLIALHELLQNADGYIGNDSGVTHLSAFLKIPTVAVFGPSDSVRWHPIGPYVRVLVSEKCPKIPCFETQTSPCNDCLADVPPDSAISALLGLFSRENGKTNL